MTWIRTFVFAAAAAGSLAGCASAPPFTVEESLWFDKATGPDITGLPQGLRMRTIGYPPPPVHRIYRGAPPPPPPPPDEP